MEEEIKLAAKLYRCRDSAKSLAKINDTNYHEMIKDYMDIIKAVMAKEKLHPLQALLVISETKTYQDSGMNQLLFMASVVEILEPSKAA